MPDIPADTRELSLLQAYVDGNPALHEAVGARPEARLELRPFAQGEYNANYAFDADASAGERAVQGRWLLRVNKGSQMHLADQIGYEFAALQLLAPSGRTPRAVYVDGACEALPWGILVEERLPGRPLRYESDLAEAAAIFADIHALPEPPATYPLARPAHPVADIFAECEGMYARYRTWPQADPQVVRRIDALVERGRAAARTDELTPAPARRHIVNTEVNSSNFLINDGGRSYLVDWEKPVLGEPAQDLAHFLVPTTTFWKTDTILTRAEMDAFVARYREAVAGRFDTTNLTARLQDYLAVTCLRGVTWCAMAYVEYCEPGRALRNAATFEKIRAYLQPGFLDVLARDYFGM